MLDNQLIALLIKTIIDQEAIAGTPDTPVLQAFQPTQQGINTGPTAYMYKLGDRRVGMPYRANVYNSANDKIVHTEIQQYETSFQISALSTQDPTNVTQLTASDILNKIAYILQSESTVEILQQNDVGILNIAEVRNPYFTDDRDRHAAAPSFDFTVVHKQIVTSSAPVLQSTELKILTV